MMRRSSKALAGYIGKAAPSVRMWRYGGAFGVRVLAYKRGHRRMDLFYLRDSRRWRTVARDGWFDSPPYGVHRTFRDACTAARAFVGAPQSVR